MIPLLADLLDGPVPDADIVLVADLFYEAALAERVTRYLDRCLAAGITCLVGDPMRAYLPRERLTLLADYAVPDFTQSASGTPGTNAVFSFGRAPA